MTPAAANVQNLTVVLVRTLEAGNIGSAARAMMNMGVQRLKLVAPAEVDTPEARRMAGKAGALLRAAQIYPDLEAALSGEHLVVGTTSTRERRSRLVQTPRQAASLIRAVSQQQRVALVFGSERGGLSREELSRCTHLVSIPASSKHPVLNLAQSVLVLLYEICSAEEAIPEDRVLASQSQRREMFQQMQDLLVEIGFLPQHNPEHIMSSIRDFLGRAALDEREVRILRGILSHLQWFVQEGRTLPSAQVKKK